MKALKQFLPRMIALAAVLVSPFTARAAGFDAFLEIDGIEGESTKPGHVGEIDIESFSWSVKKTNAAAGPTLSEFVIAKKVDKSSPKLFEACAQGQPIPTVTLTCRKAGTTQPQYYTVTFEECLVSSYQSGGSSGDDRPTESISFNYTKITFTYQPQDANGVPTGPPVIGRWPPGTPGTP
jgi:type VI secretion system secreted protein Hcp